MIRSGRKKLSLTLAGLMVLSLTGMGIWAYVNHLLTTPVTIEDVEVDSDAVLKLNLMEQVSKKNGKTEWKLKATSATLLKAQDKAVLKDVDVIFYTEEKTEVHLTADRGILNTKTHDLRFEQNVVIRHQAYTLRSETLHYDKKVHIIHTDSRVTVEDGKSVLEADTMVTKLNQNQLILKGNVKGYFSEQFNLP